MNRTKISLLALSGLALTACHSGGSNEFTAEGTISGAAGKTLYLEQTDTDEPLLVDSLLLGKDGKFRFRGQAHRYPTFYRLRLGEEYIPFAADSLTHLELSSRADRLFDSYEILSDDPVNKQIREIAQLRDATDKRIQRVLSALDAGTLSRESARSSVDSLSAELRRTLSTRYIYTDPKSAAAYFALFQSFRGGSYYSIDQAGDERAYGAVATAYETYFPEAPYTDLLRRAALQALSRSRARYRELHPDTTNTRPVEVVAFPELKFRDQRGQERSLTALAADGKPILLSFTSYAADWSPALVNELRRLQSQHPELTIYEVALDGDSYLWRNATRTIPWISVLDLKGESAQLYNVQQLPSFFSIRGSELKRLSEPADMYR